MKKVYFLVLTVFLLYTSYTKAQIITVDPSGFGGITTSSSFDNIYSTDEGRTGSRYAYIYQQSDLAPLAANTVLNAIEFSRQSSHASGRLSTVGLKIYLKNTSDASIDPNAVSWAGETAGATLVYDGLSEEIKAIVGNSNGLKKFPFSTLFTYTGNNLEVLIEYRQSNNAPISIQWGYFDAPTYGYSPAAYAATLETNIAMPMPSAPEFSGGTTDHILTLRLYTGTPTPPTGSSITIDPAAGTGTATTNSAVIYTSSSVNAAGRFAFIYPKSVLGSLVTSDQLNNIEFTRMGSSSSSLSSSGTYSFKIYLKNTSATSINPSTANWATETAGATLVYDGSSADIITRMGNSNGGKKFPFSSLFTYTGNNLELLIEYTQSNAAPLDIQWKVLDVGGFTYRAAIATTASSSTPLNFSGSTISTAPVLTLYKGSSILPIVLKNFKAESTVTGNKLSWVTLGEQNNKSFIIERSSNGQQFVAMATIATKALNGNSSDTIHYEYEDKTPLAGNNYYRLKQIDIDGKFSLSSIAVVKNKEGIFEINAYPNPVKEQINLTIQTSAASAIQIIISDVHGKEVKRTSRDLVTGKNSVPLDVQELVPGSYFIKLVDNTTYKESLLRFIK